MISAEKAAGFDHIIPGEEKYFAVQDTQYHITRPGEQNVTFVTPRYRLPKKSCAIRLCHPSNLVS